MRNLSGYRRQVRPARTGRRPEGTVHYASADVEWLRNPLDAADAGEIRARPHEFSARIAGQVNAPASGYYEFYLRHNGGVRFSLDGVKLFEEWQDVDNDPLEADANRGGKVDFEDLVRLRALQGADVFSEGVFPAIRKNPT